MSRERKFDPTMQLVALRPIRSGGRSFAVGDSFDWKRLSVSFRRTKILFDLKRLGTKDELKPQPTAPETPSSTDVELPEGFDDMGMKDLRKIAQEIGAPTKVSLADQREAIIEKLKENADG